MKLSWRDFGLLGVIIYFTFIGGTFYSQLNFTLRVANQVIVTLILGVWLLARLRKRSGLPATTLDLALAIYLGVNVLAALLGQSPRFSFEAMWLTIVHVLGFYLLVDLFRRGSMPRLVWAFYMASAVVCLVALLEFVAWYTGWPPLPLASQGWWEIGGWGQPIPPYIYRLSITLNGPTMLSAYLALLIPPALALVICLPKRNQNRQALMLWLIMAFIVQFLAASRAGLLALATSLPLTGLAWYTLSGQNRQSVSVTWRRIGLPVRLVFIGAVVVLVAAGLFWLQASLSVRAQSTNFRLTLWRAAAAIVQDDPLTGAGPANFGRALLRLNDTTLPRLQIASAHNVYFNTAAELGLLGLLAGTCLYLAVAWTWARRWQQARQSSPLERLGLAAVGAALAGLAVQTLVDTYSATPNILPLMAMLAYLAAGLPVVKTPARRHLAAYLALAVLIGYAAGFFWLARADNRFQASFIAESRGNLEEAVRQASLARQLDPALTLRTFRLALLEARLARQTDDPVYLAAAIDHYRVGLQQEPILGLNSANLAGLLWQRGQQAEAITLMEETITAEAAPLYLLNLGYFYEQAGDWARAREAYGRALYRAPALAGSGFWQADPARTAVWPDIVAAAVELAEGEAARQSLLVNLALAREDFETLAEVIDTASTSEITVLQTARAELYLHRGQPAQAGALLEPEPRTGQDYLAWGRVRLLEGHEAEAERLFKIAAFLGIGRAYYYLGQLYEQQGRLAAAELAYQRGFSPRVTSENIEVTIYGRRSGNDLAPQLLRIGVSPGAAASWLALAGLHEAQGRYDQARTIYRFLLAEDPYLNAAQERLALLADAAGE